MTRGTGKRQAGWCAQRALEAAFVLLLVLGTTTMVGCGLTTSKDTGEEPEAAQDVTTAQDDEASASDTRDTWAAECQDRHDDLTVYALSKLSGSQLERLMKQGSYNWSTRNQCWLKDKGTSAVAVYDAEGKTLDDQQIEELGPGLSEDSVSYRLVTSRYSSVKRAYDALVGKVMTCDDVELGEEAGVAVVSDERAGKALVFLSWSDDITTVTFLSEGAVANGLFDNIAGQEMGSTVAAVFETLAGRIPGDETT